MGSLGIYIEYTRGIDAAANTSQLTTTLELSCNYLVAAPRTFTVDEIAALAELPRRTVRYYIQTGLVDRPEGIGKGAYYTQHHIDQLLRVRKWTLAGLSLERIAEVLKQPTTGPLPPTPRRAGTVEVWSHLVVADGVEVTLEPGRAGLSPEQVRAFFRGVSRVYQQIHESEDKE
jgi:DNA-binding transcriptional MerR regulator